MAVSHFLLVGISLLHFFVNPVFSKLVTVPFNDPRILYTAGWDVLTPPPASSPTPGLFTPAPKTTAAVAQSAQAACDKLSASAKPSWVESSIPGATLSFEFVGTRVSILTASGAGATRFSVIRDDDTNTTAQVVPGVLGTSDCRATYESAPLANDGKTHTLSVTVESAQTGEAMRVLAIVYDDGKAEEDASSHDGQPSAGTIIAIAVVATILGLLAVIVPLIWCCRRQGRPMFIEAEEGSSALRVVAKEKAIGLLSSTPTFLRHDGTKKVKTHIRLMSDELDLDTQPSKSRTGTTEYSRFSLLKPPVPRKPVPQIEPPVPPVAHVREQQQQPGRAVHWQVHNRTQQVTYTDSTVSHGRF